jgi:hypothetical protein
MEAVYSSDASVNLYRTTRRHIPRSLRVFVVGSAPSCFSVWQCISQTRDSAQGMIAYQLVNTNAIAVGVVTRRYQLISSGCSLSALGIPLSCAVYGTRQVAACRVSFANHRS